MIYFAYNTCVCEFVCVHVYMVHACVRVCVYVCACEILTLEFNQLYYDLWLLCAVTGSQ